MLHARRPPRGTAAIVTALLSACSPEPRPPAVGRRPPPRYAAPGDDDEGGTAALRDQLDAASKGFLDAKAKLGHLGEAPEGARRR